MLSLLGIRHFPAQQEHVLGAGGDRPAHPAAQLLTMLKSNHHLSKARYNASGRSKLRFILMKATLQKGRGNGNIALCKMPQRRFRGKPQTADLLREMLQLASKVHYKVLPEQATNRTATLKFCCRL